jgi:hypothetical protein
VPPYLHANGGTFSAATYPFLALILGSTTLPDSPGRARFALNSGTGRLTTAGAGIDGNTAYAAGGNNGVTLASSHIPSGVSATGSNTITVTSTRYILNNPAGSGGSAPGGGNQVTAGSAAGEGAVLSQISMSGSNSITVTTTNSSQGTFANAAPGYVGGITMIRAG